MIKHKVTFLPDNIQAEVASGETIMMAAAEGGVEFEGPCGGRGICGKCKVNILEGQEQGTVLACQTKVTADLVVEIPRLKIFLSKEKALIGKELAVEIAPGIEKLCLQVEPDSLGNQVADGSRLLKALNKSYGLTLEAMRSLPHSLREQQHLVTVVLADKQVLAIEAGDTSDKPLYGLAVDIGTTTVVANLVDLTTGETKGVASGGNTQNIFGADVISRIQYASKGPKELEQISGRVLQVLNRLIAGFTKEFKITAGEIFQAVIVCNTTMHHLFLGLDPKYLAPSPFTPVATDLVSIKAKEIGLDMHPEALIHLLPNVAGYVGADTVGVILSTGIYETKKPILAVDIGTNGEIALALPDKIYTCSTAAGPAFEGAQIEKGMRAQNGAIERVRIEQEKVHYQVIGQTSAKGICGSGLIDAISEMARQGILEPGGRLTSGGDHLSSFLKERIVGSGGQARFVIATVEETGGEEVYLTQKDIREVQLAKAAIRAGIQLLLNDAGLLPADLGEVLLAGAFGTYIDRNAALGLGLLPQVDVQKIRAVGNAAIVGAKMALLNKDLRELSVEVAKKAEHLELSTRTDFQEAFLKSLNF
ncbi:MAG: ASKHA domain-containing protein [Bacillota bacterium]